MDDRKTIAGRASLKALALLLYASGAGAFLLASEPTQRDLGAIFRSLAELFEIDGPQIWICRIGVIVCGAVLACSGWWTRREEDKGRSTLLLLGSLMILLLVVGHLLLDKLETKQPETKALWPLVLAAAAFLYLWWLGILIFDLAFVWHRYIRNSVALDHLQSWGPTEPGPTGERGGEGFGSGGPATQMPVTGGSAVDQPAAEETAEFFVHEQHHTT
jgi:hypothetical protein